MPAVQVIGVAKSEFAGTPEDGRVFRGRSRLPLFVTAIGVPLDLAKTRIAAMHGPHRIPTLLRMVDRVGREHADRGPEPPAFGR